MIKRERKKQPDGSYKTFIRVVESYRPGKGMLPKQRAVRAFGYLEDQPDQEAFMVQVEAFNTAHKAENIPLKIDACLTSRMYSEENRRWNYGYKFLQAVYDMLDIDGFIEEYLKRQGFRGEYSPAKVFKFLVLCRILEPDSKRATFAMKNGFYGMDTDFSLQDVYRALDVFAGFEVELQRHLNEWVKQTVGRDLSHAFYDVTNYYFDIDFPDGEDDLRRKGVSKEHRTSPIVGMGLFMDDRGLPVCMSVFPGNTSESLTLIPTMNDIKASYGLGRLVVVSDKGINTSNNINTIVNAGDGFVFSHILRGKKGQRYHTVLFDPAGWTENKEGTYRYKLFVEEYEGRDVQGNKVIRKRKVLLYWDKADCDMARRKREDKLKLAARSVANNAYSIKKGVDEYTQEAIIDKTTGEQLQNIKKRRSVNVEKAEQDALFDGYFCIVTSELDHDETKIRQAYGGLWKIEQSFRIMKSDLYARPVFVSNNDHIRAHFLICFVALLVVRLFQLHMGKNALSPERIARALNAANLRLFKNSIILLDDIGGAIAFQKTTNKKGQTVDTLAFSSKDEIALDYKKIQNTFKTNCCDMFIRLEHFNKFLKTIPVTLH